MGTEKPLISWGDLTEEKKSFVEAYMLCFKGKDYQRYLIPVVFIFLK